MAKDKILKQKVHHDGVSMVVLKAGDKYAVPANLRQTWIDEHVIAGKTSKEIAQEEAARAAAETEDDDEDEGEDDTPIFTSKHVAGGLYEIFGPGLDEPERVKGKTETQVRIVELTEAYKAEHQDGGADGAGAPPV
jgi:hypothetical protein